LDYFNDVFTYFSGPADINYITAIGVSQLLNLIKNILICVPKMNGSLVGLEQCEGEKLLTEFSFLGELPIVNTIY